jgi:hypothetical protein
MRTFLRGKVTLLFIVCAVLIAVPAVAAIADQLRIDGDTFNTSNSANTTFTLCPGVGGSVNQKATINFQGSDHFANLATVTITASVQSTAQNFITATGASVVTGTSSNAWNNSSDSVSTGDLPLTVDTDWAAGTYDVTYTATGNKAGPGGGTLTLTDTSKITIEEATSGCQAPNEAPVVNVVGPEDGATYEINDVPAASCSVTDEDANASATPDVGAIVGGTPDLSAYGLGSVTVTCSYTDSGQETGTDTVTYTIVDTGDPVITEQSHTPDPADGDNGWHVSAVTTTFQAEDFNGSTPADAGAGFFSSLANPHNFDRDSGTAEGDNVSINSGTVQDVAGNESNNASSGPFMIDLTKPNIVGAIVPLAPAGTGWYNIATGAPKAKFLCTDLDGDNDATNGEGSGVASCEADYTFGSSADPQSHTGNGSDNAGLTNSTSVGPVKVDLSKPTGIAFTGSNVVTDGATYAFGSVPAAPTGCTADDTFSGLKSCTLDSGYGTGVGSHTIKATATDNAGNVETKTLTYTVDPWNATGFYSPVGTTNSKFLPAPGPLPTVNSTGEWNTVKGGSTVPLKFNVYASVGGPEKTSTDDIQYLKAQQMNCSATTGGTMGDPVDFTTTEQTSLRYSGTPGVDGQFIQNWKTPKVSGTTCYRTAVTLDDGSSIYAFFQLLK